MKTLLSILFLTSNAFATEISCQPGEFEKLNDEIKKEACRKSPLRDPELKDLKDQLVRAKLVLELCENNPKSVVRHEKAVSFYGYQAIDCSKDVEIAHGALAYGLVFLNPKNKFSDSLSLFESPAAYKEFIKSKDGISAYLNAKSNIPYKKSFYETAMNKVDLYLCPSEVHQEELDKRSLPEGCSVGALPEPKVVCGSKSNAVKTIATLEEVFMTPGNCEEKVSKIKAIFTGLTVGNIDDAAVLGYFAKHMDKVSQDPNSRNLFLGALEAANPLRKKAQTDEFNPLSVKTALPPLNSSNHSASALEIRMGLIGLEQAAFHKNGFEGYNDFCSSGNKQKLIIDEVVIGLDKLVSDAEFRTKVSSGFSKACDGNIAGLFGNKKTVARACGGSLSGGHRPHEFNNTHIYGDENGGGVGEPVFLPTKNLKSGLYPGGQAKSNGSYWADYSKLGIYNRPMSININHLGTPNLKSVVKNDRGSLQMGTMGGPGGESDGKYTHLHVELVATGDKDLKFNMADAFCRDIPFEFTK